MWGGFSTTPRYNYEGFRFSNFAGLRNFLKSNLPNHHFRRGKVWLANVDFDGSPTVGGFQPDVRRYNYERFPLFQFYGIRNFLKVIPRIATSDGSHFGQYVDFEGRQRWAYFSTIFAHYNNEGFPNVRIYGFTELFKK